MSKGLEKSARESHAAFRPIDWLEARTGAWEILRKVLDERIPGGARFAYVFGSGLLFILTLQAITGVSLALYYTPTAETAHTSVEFITKRVAGGAFLRSLHSYGASGMIVVLGLHFLQTFLYGSFKGRRELLWISGATLSLLVLGMGFTGYLLPWDQKAYFATAVGTNIMGEMPLVGNLLTRLVRGGDTIGTLTLSRFYVAHVFLIPAAMFLLVAVHVFLFRKAGPAGPVHEHPIEPTLPAGKFYPLQVLLDMAFALAIIAALCALAYLRSVTLGPIANPADTHFLPRPEWYYLPMFEWLKFWEGPQVVVGAVVIPGLLATIFFLLPFFDRHLERRPWRRPIPVLGVALVVLGAMYLGVRSKIEDGRGAIASQLALQEQEEKAYSASPFRPLVDSSDGVEAVSISSDPPDPAIAMGRAIFTQRGCIGCHGGKGTGTAIAPSLVGVTRKISRDQLIALLHNPNPRMKAAGMPAVNSSPHDMTALLTYLDALGTPAANVQESLPAQATSRQPQTAFLRAAHNAIHVEERAAADLQGERPAIDNGRRLFQEHACFACHGPSGTGGLAPALAPLVAQVTDEQLRQLLQTPNQRMRAGGMPAIQANLNEMRSLTSYLRSLPLRRPLAQPHTGELAERAPNPIVDPPRDPAADPPISRSATETNKLDATRQVPQSETAAGRVLFLTQGCVACHGQNAQGTRIAPSLLGVSVRFPGNELPTLLRHPNAKMRAGGMPTPAVSDVELKQLVSYLGSLAAPAMTASGTEMMAKLHPIATQAADVEPSEDLVESVRNKRLEPQNPLVERGRALFRRNGCAGCHGTEGAKGTIAAPGLAGTASLLPEPVLQKLLRHYSAKMRAGGMPPTKFSATELAALVAYIRSMSSSPQEESRLTLNPIGMHK